MLYKKQIDLIRKNPFVSDNLTDMDIIKINERLEFYESFKKVFENDISIEFLQDLHNRCNGRIDNNAAIFIYGDKGSIKTGIALEIVSMFYPDFDVDSDLVFSNQDLKDAMAGSRKGQWFVRDETIKDFGTGSKQLESDIQMFVETLRKRKNSLIFICPTYHPVKAMDYILNTYKGNLCWQHKQACFGIVDPTGSQRYIGSGRVSLDWNGKTWKRYCKRKDEFVERAAKVNVQTYNLEKDANRIMKHKDFLECKSKKEVTLFVREQMPHSTVAYQDDVVTKIGMMLRKETA